MIIPLDILNGLRYNDWVEVYERSLCMLVYAQETVELDWYQSDWFRFIFQVAAIVYIVWTGDFKSGVEFLAWLSVQAAIYIVAVKLAEMIGGDAGVLLAALVTIYLSITYQNYSGMESAGWLANATQGLAIGLQLKQHMIELEMQELQKDQNAYMQEKEKEIEYLNNEVAEYESRGGAWRYAEQVFKEFDMIGARNPRFQTIEGYVSGLINTEWLVDGDWMYNIDRQIAIRQQPYVGV